ncbi:Flp family type IVb pilin [Arthrobacter sp. SA17]
MTSLMVSMMAFVAGVKDRLSNEKGATAVEYGLLVALIAAVIIAVVATLGTQIEAAFQTIVDELPVVVP